MRDSRDHPESVKSEYVSDTVISRLQVFLQFCMLSCQYILFLIKQDQIGSQSLEIEMDNTVTKYFRLLLLFGVFKLLFKAAESFSNTVVFVFGPPPTRSSCMH